MDIDRYGADAVPVDEHDRANSVFSIRGEGSDQLSVRVDGYEHPEATDEWDGNWLRGEIQLKAGGFSGHYGASILAPELESFRSSLSALHEQLTGEATFSTLESQLELRVVGDGLGHMSVEGTSTDRAGGVNTLRFALELDQTQLGSTLEQLGHVTARYPQRGELPWN